jgi:folate-binding protein YgfZ
MSAAPQTIAEPLDETPLATHLRLTAPASLPYQGALTPRVFSTLDQELISLTTNAGIFDLGYKAYLQITGSDRLRWLNGMVTNTIQALPEDHWNYSFLLSAQGRIQGDANIYRIAENLILQTDRSQIARLSAHLDHFIIMDDVELHVLDASRTTIGILGPRAAQVLASLGAAIPEKGAFVETTVGGTQVTLVHAQSALIPRFEIWMPATQLVEVWSALQQNGAAPCGLTSIEAVRILEALPLYGVDIQERHLAQETSQTRALNFNKGCYLGQEIVERIRSRATVHRNLRQFSVENAPAVLEPGQTIELNAEGAERNPVGALTSLAHYKLPRFTGSLALGFIQTAVIERGLKITHNNGTVTGLDALPAI